MAAPPATLPAAGTPRRCLRHVQVQVACSVSTIWDSGKPSFVCSAEGQQFLKHWHDTTTLSHNTRTFICCTSSPTWAQHDQPERLVSH